jgi:hypothetical protein
MLTYDTPALRQTGSRNVTGKKTLPTPLLPEGGGRYTVTSVCPSKIFFVAFFSVTVDGRNLIFGHKHHIGIPYCVYKCMLNVYKNQQNRQTGSRNLMGPKTLPTILGTYMKLVTKYQISVINSCWEKCDEKCAYMFNVYKNQLSRQSVFGPIRFLLPVCRFCWFLYTFNIHLYMHIFRRIFLSNYWWQKSDVWSQASYRYHMMLVTKYQISANNSYWEKCDEKYLGWTEGWKDGRKDGQR